MLNNFSYVIVGHIYTTGPGYYLEEYLKTRSKKLIFIGHPFPNTRKPSFLRIYENGKLVSEKEFFHLGGPEFISYFKDFFLTIWWIYRNRKHVDYYIGFDNFNAFTGNFLKSLGVARKTIFYTIDYIPNRFPNKILNYIYHFLDRLAVRKSDAVWNLSSLMAEEREKKGISRQFRNKQIVVPIGTNISTSKIPFSRIDRFKIIFIGHLRENQGVDLLISAMKEVIRRVPKARLLIVGGGPLEGKLKEFTRELMLGTHVEFTGFLDNYLSAQKYMKDSAIGAAPYKDSENSFTRYTDPGKPKDYLANGIPVIITKVPQVAYEIEKKKCGIAITYSKSALENGIIKLLTMPEDTYKEYRRNALKMAKEYTWDKIFYNAFNKTIALK